MQHATATRLSALIFNNYNLDIKQGIKYVAKIPGLSYNSANTNPVYQ
jgi:hypothetical protein